MRRLGKSELGSGVGPRTGHPACLRPARMATTSEKLSARVRCSGWLASARTTAESTPALRPVLSMVSGLASLAAPPSIEATAVAGFPDAESFFGSVESRRDDRCLSPQAMRSTSRVMSGSRMLQTICNGRALHEASRSSRFWRSTGLSRCMRIALLLLALATPVLAQRYSGTDGKLRIALAKQPYSPTGTSVGPTTMANGGIQQQLA